MKRTDTYWLNLARQAARLSNDPSTQVGAVVVSKFHELLSMKANGLHRLLKSKFSDKLDNREEKLELVIHAEAAAIIDAACDLRGCTIYVTFPPCSRCASLIIESGLERVVVQQQDVPERWQTNAYLAKDMLNTAGVIYDEIV